MPAVWSLRLGVGVVAAVAGSVSSCPAALSCFPMEFKAVFSCGSFAVPGEIARPVLRVVGDGSEGERGRWPPFAAEAEPAGCTTGRPENGNGPLWPVLLILKIGLGRDSPDAAELVV